MSKSRFAGAAAIAASLVISIASAEGSGALAQTGEESESAQAITLEEPLTQETVPVFVSNEVVQEIPVEAATPEQTLEAADTLRQLLAQTEAPQALSDELECLAGAIYFESRGEPLDGQLAVAQVVINRAESRVFPASYCGVVTQRAQFSFVRNGRIPSARKGSSAWQRAKKIARIAHEGLWESKAGDSLYFHAKYVKPRWSRSKQARATINTHIFYR